MGFNPGANRKDPKFLGRGVRKMASHVYHESLEGFDKRQIWHDGCPECEYRGSQVPDTIGYLDEDNLRRAVERSVDVFYHNKDVGEISRAEYPLLNFFRIVVSIQKIDPSILDPGSYGLD